MRALKVFREIPSSAAVREMFQPVCCSTSATRSRTASSSELGDPAGVVVAAAAFAGATTVSPSASAVTTGSDESSATRSIRLATSRTLPGHGYARSAACASAAKVFADTP